MQKLICIFHLRSGSELTVSYYKNALSYSLSCIEIEPLMNFRCGFCQRGSQTGRKQYSAGMALVKSISKVVQAWARDDSKPEIKFRFGFHAVSYSRNFSIKSDFGACLVELEGSTVAETNR